MLVSQFLLATVKETPADAEIISHQLMLRAGMIRKLASGLYTWLPLGLRTLRKVENIVREEMNGIGSLELLMTMVQPAELWEESGRWQQYGPELLRIADRHKRNFCLGPTHEEVITDIARRELRSYRQLPMCLYQVATKFRDEIRPRFGVMRAREFIMKDAYSFHVDQKSLQKTYDDMYGAYSRIFTRLGLNFRAVLADTGSIGGHFSHEFQVLAESGEDVLVYSDVSDYAANLERAESAVPFVKKEAPKALEKFTTPNAKTIKALEEQFNIKPENGVKTLIVKGSESKLIALILRGDHEINTIKAEKLPGVFSPLTMADEAEIKLALNCSVGSLGPVDLPIPFIVDRDAATLHNFVCGANEEDVHYKNVNWGRDAQCENVADLRNVCVGDASPDGKGFLKFARGIEVGHIFQLGDKYSKSMNLSVLDESGKPLIPQMGCYGIGVSRIVASAIEQNHDEKGIIWSEAMAPFQVAIVPIGMQKSERVKDASEKLYTDLKSAGFDVLMDDRNERPGVMFSDMDLIGIPHRLVISDRGLEQGTAEYKNRRNPDLEQWPITEIISKLQEAVGGKSLRI